MDVFDHPHSFLTECARDNSLPKYSVGYYRGRRRVIIGWFLELERAECFAERVRVRYPSFRIDILESMF